MALIFLLYPPLLSSLEVVRGVLAHGHEEVEVLIFDLAPFMEALAQFEHSSEVVELMLAHCLHLRLGVRGLVFGLVRAVVLSSNLAEAYPNRSVSLVGGILRVFMRYPSASSDIDWFLASCCYTTPTGGCTILCGRCVLPLCGLRQAVQAANFMSLRTTSAIFCFVKDTPPPWFDCFAL
jgi:hypothetical protein